MLDLYNNKYDRETLKQNIYAVKLIDILKTQKIDVSFVVRYILNENYQLHHEDTIITEELVLFYQPHISKSSLLVELLSYSSDDDSVDDFEFVSNKENLSI
jgi:hypothetical protein